MSSHKSCYGTMFHDTLHYSVNQPMKGKVFTFQISSEGLARTDRRVTANVDEWDDCRACEEFDHCYKFSMATLLMQSAIEKQ